LFATFTQLLETLDKVVHKVLITFRIRKNIIKKERHTDSLKRLHDDDDDEES